MAHVCPIWVGRLLLNPLRRLTENPIRILGPYVSEGMTVLEPGCAMGYFTLPLARMVGEKGRVVAVDVQQGMLHGLEKRAAKAGLSDRLDARLCNGNGLGVDDLIGQVDFAAALHVVHETPDQERFMRDVHDALKPGAKLLVIEPKSHVSDAEFENMKAVAASVGLKQDDRTVDAPGRKVLFVK